MTTTLKWRLSKLPTVDELLKLVNDKIITQEEAKEILFNKETENERDNESLKSEIKFLREIIDNLSKNNKTTVVEVIKEYRPLWSGYNWYQPYASWFGDTGTISSVYTTSNLDSTMGLSTNRIEFAESAKFSDIKTF